MDARQAFMQMKYKFAEEKLRIALGMDSNRVEAYYCIGLVYYIDCEMEGKNCDTCIFYFNKAIEKNKDYENPHFYIGSCKGTVHDFNGALKEFNIAIEKHSDTLVYARRAKIKVQLKDLVGACEDYYNSAQLGSILSREIFDRNCYTKPKDK